MADSRFFKNNGPFQLNDLAAKVNGQITNCTNQDQITITDVASLHTARIGHITCFHNTKYQESLRNTQASVCIIHPDHVNKAPQTLALLVHPKPYRVYGIIAQMFYPDEKENLISSQAIIDSTAKVGGNCYIGPFAYIGAGVEIGDNCWIDSHVTITHALIGKNVRIKTGARIGQKGFGFHMDEEGHLNVPQLGYVIIEDNVEIGANTTIDRGSEPNTVIGQGTRIDNLVQIAHNVQIGAHCVIVAQAGIAGSSQLGNGVVIAGQAGIAGHLHLGDRVQVAGQSGVMRDAEKGEIIAGSPAIPVREWHKQNIILKRLITKPA